MAINFSVADFYESLIDLIGYKSGVVVDQSDIIHLLKEDDQLVEFADLPPGGCIRIRPESYESVIEYLLYRMGRLENRWNMLPGIDLYHKYKNNPRMITLVHDIGAAFTSFLEDAVEDRTSKKVDPTPFVLAMAKKHGREGARMALHYVEGMIAYQVRSPWGRMIGGMTASEYDNLIELKSLFESEGLDPQFGKFIDQRYIDFLHRNFHRIDEINWRKFEGLTAEFFDREGFYIELGPGRNDDGVDARIWPKEPNVEEPPTIVVQCKRQKTAIEKVVVKALYADVLSEKATSGLIVTTSKLSVGAKKVLRARHYPIEEADRSTLRIWIENMRTPGAGSFL